MRFFFFWVERAGGLQISPGCSSKRRKKKVGKEAGHESFEGGDDDDDDEEEKEVEDGGKGKVCVKGSRWEEKVTPGT